MSSSDNTLSHPSDPIVTFHRLPARIPSVPSASIYTTKPPAHHVGGSDPPASFKNPWPSFAQDGVKGLFPAMHAKFFSKDRNFVPVPSSREELVEVVAPDWGWGGEGGGGSGEGQRSFEAGEEAEKGGGSAQQHANAGRLKATWIGHSSWLVETGVKRDAPVATPSITLTDDADEPTTTTLSPVEAEHPRVSSSSRTKLVDGSSPDEDERGGGDDDGGDEHQDEKEKSFANRGVRILLDPVFSTRVSPVRFAGPKRFNPPPCALADLPDPIDVVAISHDHYDHLDTATVKFLVGRERARQRGSSSGGQPPGRGILFLIGLGGARHLLAMGVREEEVLELDWWEGVRVAVRGVRGAVKLVCTPTQHFSGRGVWDAGKALWCSWVVQELGVDEDERDDDDEGSPSAANKRLFFAGDSGYRSVPEAAQNDREAVERLSRCPAFAEVGATYGPFDLALLPIGCYSPRWFMSPVHAAPADAVAMHKDLRSRRSVAMHYGTLRGGISEQYEDVREPPRLWKEEAEREGLRWGDEAAACKIGETVLV
ncbi:putative n-acyl-phosphatidylethanolamine-hydrolyzing phospholipase d protein [Neofusicoccum parvum]|nr:putative n-acyl-phosphatidylethanolamine-hydrolyzing phospholipase d protein [Neofusicoccum parvum]